MRNLEKTCLASSAKQLKKLTTLKQQLGFVAMVLTVNVGAYNINTFCSTSQDVSVKDISDMQSKLRSIRETLPQTNKLVL